VKINGNFIDQWIKATLGITGWWRERIRI